MGRPRCSMKGLAEGAEAEGHRRSGTRVAAAPHSGCGPGGRPSSDGQQHPGRARHPLTDKLKFDARRVERDVFCY